jgi:hypothetical protein
MCVSASNISALSVRPVAGRASETGGQGVDGVDGRSIAGATASADARSTPRFLSSGAFAVSRSAIKHLPVARLQIEIPAAVG